MLGVAFGAAGAWALQAVDAAPLLRTLYVVANLFLLVLAARLALGTAGFAWLQQLGAGALRLALPAARPLLRRPGATGRIALGLVWGLMPCALVYSVLPLALFAGGAWQGGATMLAFGLGTLPNLVVTGVLIGKFERKFDGVPLRYAAAALMAAFALAGMWRAVVDPDALSQGAFCLMP